MSMTVTLEGTPPPDGDRNIGSVIIVLQAVFVGICTVLVTARLATRYFVVKKLGWEDLFIVLSLLCAMAAAIIDGVRVHYGGGRHVFYLMATSEMRTRLPQAIKWQYISKPPVVFSMMFTRLSICVFLLRIFTTERIWRWVIYSIMIFTIVTNVPSAFIVLVQCSPIEKLWNSTLPGKCGDPSIQTKMGVFHGAISIFSDWALASIPTVLLWNSQMTVRTKVIICILMGMGFMTGACAVVRTVFVSRLDFSDITWTAVDLDVWAVLEETIGIIAACIPTLKPLSPILMRSFGSIKARISKVTTKSKLSYYDAGQDQFRSAGIVWPPMQPSAHAYFANDDGNEINSFGPLQFSHLKNPPHQSQEVIWKKTEFSLDSPEKGSVIRECVREL